MKPFVASFVKPSIVTRSVREILHRREATVFSDYIRHGQMPTRVTLHLIPGPFVRVSVKIGGVQHTWSEKLGADYEPLVKKAS